MNIVILQAAYAKRQTDAKELLDRLSLALKAHEQAANQQPKNWGFLGDINAACDGLTEALRMLNGVNEAERVPRRF